MSFERPQRLRDRGDGLAKLIDTADQAQRVVPQGAQKRVFHALFAPRPARWPLAAAAAAALAIAILVAWPRHRPASLRLLESAGSVSGTPDALLQTGPDGAALLERDGLRIALGPQSALRMENGLLRLEQGEAAFLVHGAFSLQAGALRVEAGEALLVASVRERAAVYSRRGAIRADGVQVPEGGRWPADAPPPDALAGALADMVRDPARGVRSLAQLSLAQLQTPPRQTYAPEDLLARARDEERAGHFPQAASLYAQLAQGDGPRAGNALYELARLRLRSLDQPAQALQSLLEYRRRFPSGLLQLEVALTSIEARLALNQEDDALREMDSFLGRFGGSERAGEVRWLRASLHLRQGECGSAEPDVRSLLADPQRGDDALFALAACAQDEERNPAPLREYLSRFPSGRHRREAQDRLSEPP